MTTATKPTFALEGGAPRKNIYHSHLVRAGRLLVKLKDDPAESRYPKGSATHFMYFDVAGDEHEYCLAVEPETIEAFRRAPKGKWVHVTASGSKDEPPAVIVSDEAGPILPDTPAEEISEPPPLWPDDAAPQRDDRDRMISYTAVDIAVQNTILAVRALADEGIVVDPTPIYSTHFIQASRS